MGDLSLEERLLRSMSYGPIVLSSDAQKQARLQTLAIEVCPCASPSIPGCVALSLIGNASITSVGITTHYTVHVHVKKGRRRYGVCGPRSKKRTVKVHILQRCQTMY